MSHQYFVQIKITGHCDQNAGNYYYRCFRYHIFHCISRGFPTKLPSLVPISPLLSSLPFGHKSRHHKENRTKSLLIDPNKEMGRICECQSQFNFLHVEQSTWGRERSLRQHHHTAIECYVRYMYVYLYTIY